MRKENQISKSVQKIPKYVGYKHVCAALDLSRRTIERMVRAQKFPSPTQLAPNRVGWPTEEVKDWLEERRKDVDRRAVTDPAELTNEELMEDSIELLKELDAIAKELLDRHGIKNLSDLDALLKKNERGRTNQSSVLNRKEP